MDYDSANVDRFDGSSRPHPFYSTHVNSIFFSLVLDSPWPNTIEVWISDMFDSDAHHYDALA